MDKKQDPTLMTTVTHFSFKDTHSKVKERREIPCSGSQNKVLLAILISDKTDFKPKTIRDKESHYIMIKG